MMEADSTTTRQHTKRSHPLLIRGIFSLLGISVLVPWNAFISAKDYFSKRLCNPHEQSSSTTAETNVESLFAILFNVASVSSLGIVLLWQSVRQRLETRRDGDDERRDNPPTEEPSADDTTPTISTKTSHSSNNKHAYYMVLGSLCLNVAVFCGQSLLVLARHLSQASTKLLIYTSVTLSGLTGSIANAGIVMTCTAMTRSGSSDVSMMHYYFQGQAFGGLLVALANFMAASMEDPTEFQKKQCHTNTNSSAHGWISGFASNHDDWSSAAIENDYWSSLDDHSRLTAQTNTASADCSYNTIDWAVFLYFLVGSLLLIASVFGYLHVYRLSRLAAEYETIQEQSDLDLVETTTAGLEMLHPHHHDLMLINDNAMGSSLNPQPTSASPLRPDKDSENVRTMLVVPGEDDPLTRRRSDKHDETVDTIAVLRQIRGPALCIFLTFLVTLTMFPAWTSQLQSRWRCESNWRLFNDLYTPLTFVLFNAGDLVGRILSGRYPMEHVSDISNKLVTAALFRVPLGLLLFTCTGATQVTAFAVPLDLYSLGIQFLFAISNGYLVTLSFAHAPKLLLSTNNNNDNGAQERMSEILSFALSLGLLTGSFCSYPVSQLGT